MYNHNTYKKPSDYPKIHQRLHFDEEISFVMHYVEYFLHEHDFDFFFERDFRP